MNAVPVAADDVAENSPEPADLSTAETAECQCPEFCERDHDLD